jgi:quercetin dioxygenase-like cupin family protein
MILPHSQSQPTPALPGITRRTLVHGASMMLVEFSLQAGSQLPLHSHPHEQAGYLVSGKIRLTVGTETRDLGPGDSYYAPANVPHGATILEDAIVIDTFSPPREDYLPSKP